MQLYYFPTDGFNSNGCWYNCYWSDIINNNDNDSNDCKTYECDDVNGPTCNNAI